MKTKIVCLVLLSAISAWPQGGVNFNNRVTGLVDAPVSYLGGGPVPAGKVDGATAIASGDRLFGGIYAMAGLYYGPAGTPEDGLIQLGEPVHFRTGAAAGYFDGGIRPVQGLAAGATGVFQVRMWDCGVPDIISWDMALQEGASYLGKSALLNLVMTTGTVNLVGLEAFSTFTIPEPSTVQLIIVGALAMIVGAVAWGVIVRRRL